MGRGFSRNELKQAGSNMTQALKLGLPIDYKRKTVHDQNVQVVRCFLKEQKTEKHQIPANVDEVSHEEKETTDDHRKTKGKLKR
jgi:hypothetical protein